MFVVSVPRRGLHGEGRYLQGPSNRCNYIIVPHACAVLCDRDAELNTKTQCVLTFLAQRNVLYASLCT